MAAFVIYQPDAEPRVYPISGTGVSIGRSRPAALVLPDTSVSRHHAQLVRHGDRYVVTNLSRRSPLVINGMGVDQKALMNGDQVQIGRFLLVFHEGATDVPDIERDDTETLDMEITDVVPEAALRALRTALPRRDQAVVLAMGEPMGYRPGATVLVFGKDVPVRFGWLARSVGAARIQWDGRAHRIERLSPWIPLRINGVALGPVGDRGRALSPGDRLSIGGSLFRYLVDEDW